MREHCFREGKNEQMGEAEGIMARTGDRTEQMKQLLLEVKNSEPREFARELLERVLRLGGCRARDDMTVLVARIWKK